MGDPWAPYGQTMAGPRATHGRPTDTPTTNGCHKYTRRAPLRHPRGDPRTTHNIVFGFPWASHGTRCPSTPHGRPMGAPRTTHGHPMGDPWVPHVYPTGGLQKCHRRPTNTSRVMHGQPAGHPRATHGRPMRAPRTLRGQPTDNAWATHGHPASDTQTPHGRLTDTPRATHRRPTNTARVTCAMHQWGVPGALVGCPSHETFVSRP